ncbi:MAG: hypothetical protein PWQ22_1027 [Archaeoglobaceae archaeon]|nr:hypothetical protein [Archaeoglobaceae archaeon]MDK2876617.1 hypothetical protein [Archaeoglobaceae archaeon]
MNPNETEKLLKLKKTAKSSGNLFLTSKYMFHMVQTGTKSESVRRLQSEKEASRKDLHVRISKELHDWLKQNVSNISKFIEKLVEGSKNQIQSAFVLISKSETGREGFEPTTAGLRVPRSSWLSYRPLL